MYHGFSRAVKTLQEAPPVRVFAKPLSITSLVKNRERPLLPLPLGYIPHRAHDRRHPEVFRHAAGDLDRDL